MPDDATRCCDFGSVFAHSQHVSAFSNLFIDDQRMELYEFSNFETRTLNVTHRPRGFQSRELTKNIAPGHGQKTLLGLEGVLGRY